MQNLCLRILTLCALSAGIARGQQAEVSGRVTDHTGAVMPEVNVALTNTDTGTGRSAMTNHMGYYTLPLVQPGSYKINVAKTGFRTEERTGIVLQVDQHAKLDFILELGAVSQEIGVTAAEPLLDAVEPGMGQVIENRQITEMPLNGRNYVSLGLLSGGTADAAASSRYSGFSSGGQRVAANNYLLDGADNNSYEIAGAQGMVGQAAGAMVSPSIDAIQEFKVQTNSYSAEYGRGTGAVINATIKSGTNQLHGAAYEFLRNDAVDAKNYFASPTAPTPQYQRNQYGIATGGPVIKNRTFIFGDWEQTNIRTAQSTVDTVPTIAERGGDFSLEKKALANPLSPGAVFPGNIIPASLLDPVALRLINLYPAPQNGLLASNYLYNGPKDEDDRRVDVRLDHTFREADNVFVRVSNYRVSAPGALALPAPAFGADAPDQKITGWATALGWNHIFSGSLVAVTRLSWGDNQFERTNPAVGGDANFNQKYGIPGGDNSLPGGFAGFTFTGYTHLGLGAYNPGGWNTQTRQAMSDFSWSRGAQNIKFGVNLLRIQDNISQVGNEVGAWTFNGQFSGDAMADFLLGWSSQWLGSNAEVANLRGWLPAAYVQDNWKVSSRLTVNLGMRYEVSLPYYDKQDRLANFVMDNGAPHLILAGNNGGYAARSLVNVDKNGWEPRAGLVFQATSKTLIRAGFGIYRTYFEPMGDSQFLSFSPPFVLATTLSASKTSPAVDLSVGPPSTALALGQANGLTFTSYPSNPRRAYAPQWNFNIQRQFALGWKFEIGYMGERGVHLIRWFDGNFAPAEPGNINANRPIQSAVIPPSQVVASPLGPVNRFVFNGNSNYQAMAVKLERPLTRTLTLLTSYTWSKTIGDLCGESSDGNATNCGYQDPLNLRAEKALDNQNMGQRFVTSLLYNLPFGRGQQFGTQLPRALNLVAGGWELGGIFTWHTGLPYSIADSGNPANTGSLAVVDRPNVVGNPLSTPWSVNQAFNTAAFVVQPAYTYGTLGRNTLSVHSISNLDLILSKVFPLTERARLQSRFEAFNATNTPPFTGAPNATLGTNGFGQIRSAGASRVLQFALKLLW